jgi:hypothetical protein
VSDYEKAEEAREFMRAVVADLTDLPVGSEVSLYQARKWLGLKLRRYAPDGNKLR